LISEIFSFAYITLNLHPTEDAPKFSLSRVAKEVIIIERS